MFKLYKKYNVYIIMAAVTLILLVIYGIQLFALKGLVVFNDELGYWTHAATFLGWDSYSGLPESFPWYSYGYSLILSIALTFGKTLSGAYQIAIAFNILFAVLSYFLSYIAAKSIFNVSDKIALIAGALCALYPAVIFQTRIAWSEIFLMFLIWLMIVAFINYIKKTTYLNSIYCTVVVFVCYLTHNSSLGILIAYMITLAIMAKLKRIPVRHLLLSVALLSLFFAGDTHIRGYIETVEMRYYTNGYQKYNNMSGKITQLLSLMSLEGIGRLAISVIGKIWYLATSTFLIAFFAMVFLVDRIYFAFKEWKEKRQLSDLGYLYIFLLCSIIFTIGISAVSMANGVTTDLLGVTRIDPLFYGRYDEHLIGPMLLLGILYLNQRKEVNYQWYGICLIGSFLYMLISICSEQYLEKYTNVFINTLCVVGIYFYRYLFDEFSVLKCSIIVLSFFAFFVLCDMRFKNKRFIIRGISAAMLGIIFIMTSFYPVRNRIYNHQISLYSEERETFYNSLKTCPSDLFIYGREMEIIPLWMMGRSVSRIVDENGLNVLKKNDLLIAGSGELEKIMMTNQFQFLEQTAGKIVLKYTDDKYYDLQPSNEDNTLLTIASSQIYKDNWNSGVPLKVLVNLPQNSYVCRIDKDKIIPFEKLNFNEINISIYVNEKFETTICLNQYNSENELSFFVEKEHLKDGVNVIEFVPDQSWCPADYGSEDKRTLSFPIKGLEFIVQ